MIGGESDARHSWSWNAGLPANRFHAPVESFWRGLGYHTEWQGNHLVGHREFDGQQRECEVDLDSPGSGVVAIRCHVRFSGAPKEMRPGEVYDPAALTKLMGEALSRGFGHPASEQ